MQRAINDCIINLSLLACMSLTLLITRIKRVIEAWKITLRRNKGLLILERQWPLLYIRKDIYCARIIIQFDCALRFSEYRYGKGTRFVRTVWQPRTNLEDAKSLMFVICANKSIIRCFIALKPLVILEPSMLYVSIPEHPSRPEKNWAEGPSTSAENRSFKNSTDSRLHKNLPDFFGFIY